MMSSLTPPRVSRSLIITFAVAIVSQILALLWIAILKPKQMARIASSFSELYSKLWDYAGQSISHPDISLPSAMGDQPVNSINRLLLELYGGKFASLSFGGSSGALLTLLTAVLPKLHKERDLVLFDGACHQSAIGGLIFGRWKTVRLPRYIDPNHQTIVPLRYEAIKKVAETHGPKRIAAFVMVYPSYDGLRSPSEERKIYEYAQSKGITVIVDGAWDSVRFRHHKAETPPLSDISDIWITSPHKRGLTPSSLGCIITQHEDIARLWDDALDLGFRSSSVSFIDTMIAEHRLQQIISGDWDDAFSKTERAASFLRNQIKNIHTGLHIVEADDVSSEFSDPTHILINSSKIPNFNAHVWAKILSSRFGLDVEKSTATTLLLLCASPVHFDQTKAVIRLLTDSFNMALTKTEQAA